VFLDTLYQCEIMLLLGVICSLFFKNSKTAA
jgi:hypothetical protein